MMSKEYQRFYSSLHKGYLSEIRHMIFNEGCLVNYQFRDGSFPVHIAAEKGFVDVVTFLLELQPAVDLKNCHGKTALMLAIKHPEVAKRLLLYGAQVNLTDQQKCSPLHLASAQGSVSLVKELLNAGARVQASDLWGRTPLHVALLNISHNRAVPDNHLSILRLLLQHGAAPDGVDKHRSTPLYLAAAMGDSGLVVAKILLKYRASPDLVSRHRLTPLKVGAMKGYVKIVQLFIWLNCDVNLHKNHGSCLQSAVKIQSYEIAELIVASGCRLQEERWIHDRTFKPVTVNENIGVWLAELKSAPQNLRELCRGVIRRTAGLRIHTLLEGLCYPEPLKRFISLADMIPEAIRKPYP